MNISSRVPSGARLQRPKAICFWQFCRATQWSLAFLLFGSSAAVVRGEVTNGAEFFAQKIQPILQENCFKCHSHSGDKIKGGLVLDSREGVLSGGDTGPAVIPGDATQSLLIEAVSYHNEDLQMPPKGKKLSDEQIAWLSEWVKLGAPWIEEAGAKVTSRPKGKITEEDRQWWAFQPLNDPKLPAVQDTDTVKNEIDHFIFARLKADGLQQAPPAPREQWLRRVYFDLIGLPPSAEEVATFVADSSPGAYAPVVDRLLASPRYGERWARHWLDLVRYAESDGFRVDDYRPNAWPYRDYVIRAFNDDKPYDRFLQEQLAGDELFPGDIDARIATGYLRHWIYEYNNRDAVGQWTNILNDLTDTTADVFMGMGVQCARCHDHKFDPILQKDYYRLQAFFAPMLPRDDLTLATPEQGATYQEKLKAWETKTAELRAIIAEIEAPHRAKAAEGAIKIFPLETQALIRKPAAERKPWEHQIAELAYRQVTYEFDRLINKMRGPDKEKLVALYKQLSAFDDEKPTPPIPAFAATDVGPEAPPVTIPKKAAAGDISPGYLSVLDEKPAALEATFPASTGRRAALAKWLSQPENPLSTRVMVNRIWQFHFGRGLVATTSDFGKLGEKPSHPELLDWLARRFVAEGWSLKKLHRLIVLSATYQQSTQNPAAAEARLKDPENRLHWRASTRRLAAEQIRDAILATTGELDLKPGGPGEDWSKPRRSIYTKVIRNTRDPLLDVFDTAEGFTSTAERNTTTTPTQSLYMLNSQWSLARAQAFAKRLRQHSSSDPTKVIDEAYAIAFSRRPSQGERNAALAFLDAQVNAVSDRKPEVKAAPFAAEKMPFREGRAAVITPGSTQDRLVVPNDPIFPKANFTAEAYITLRSLYESGDVRTIAAAWDGKRGHPGWALGVTGKGSRYKPQTLVLLLSGDQPWSDKDPVEPIFSGLHIELGKPYFIAASVNLEETAESGITFYAKDLSNDDEPMQSATIAHKTTSGIRGTAPLVIGARGNETKHVFDGLIDDVRVSSIPLPAEQLLINKEGVSEHTVGYWKFEADPGVYQDSSKRAGDIVARQVETAPADPQLAALTDFCHVLLNSNEFLYTD